MDQIVPPNPNKLDNKNFPGAMRIVEYFEENGYNYRRIAKAFDPENARGMIAVLTSDRWNREDVKRWDVVIEKHKKLVESTRQKQAKAGTEIIKKEKKKPLRSWKGKKK